MQMDSPKTILKTIKASKKILIPLHLRPDGDMVGSALACYHFLKSLDKNPVMVSADTFDKTLYFLPAAKRIKIKDPASLELSKFDLIILLDNGDPFRYSKAGRVDLPPQLLLINIDHHDSNRGFGDLNYVNEDAAAAAEILLDLFKMWKIKITPNIANCLLTAIYADTLGFMSIKTSAETLDKAAYLIKRGADRERIVENIFQNWSAKAQKIWVLILNNMKIRKNIAYSQISYEELKKTRCSYEELSAARGFGVSRLLLPLDNVKAAAIFSEESPGQVRVSLRSKGIFNVQKIAKDMGGGGHANAAAFGYTGNLKNVVSKTIKYLAR